MVRDVLEIAPGVKMLLGVENECNIYLVEGSRRALLIDTGLGTVDLKPDVEALTDLPYDVVVTHGHADHAGGNMFFPKVYMSADAAEDADTFLDTGKILMGEGPWSVAKEYAAAHTYEKVFVDDGHCFDLGGKTVEVVSCPGHAKGCISLIDHEDRILFCGDCMVKVMDILMVTDSSLTIVEFLDSIEKLLAHSDEFDSIWTGHDMQALPVSFLSDVAECARGIVSGERMGESAKLPWVFGDDAYAPRATYGQAAIVYLPEKIR